MPEIFNVIQSEGIELVDGIRTNLSTSGTNATGQTSQSLRVYIKQEGSKYKMQILGRQFFMTVQTGRGPTKPGASPGDPSLFEGIKVWVVAKGVAGNPWAITKSIHEKGTKLWRQGGREDIVNPPVDQFADNIGAELLEAEADNFILKVRGMKW